MKHPQKVLFANSLRGVAALLVIAAHYTGVFWFARSAVSALTGLPTVDSSVQTPDLATWITLSVVPFNLGPLGVALFFLISGFVIPFAFERQSRIQFLIGRIFRIWPVYFACFLTGAAVLFSASRLFSVPLPFSTGNALLHSVVGLREIFGGPQIDGILWTLEIEIKFYIIAFAIAPLLGSGSLLSFVVPAGIFCATRSEYLAPHISFAAPYLIFMFIGVALNFLFREKVRLMPTALTIGALLLASFISANDQANVAQNYALALFIFCGCMMASRFIPDSNVLKFFANISYPLYAIHGIAGYAIMTSLLHFGASPTITLFATTTIAILAAWLVHSTLEILSIECGRRVAALVGRNGLSAMST